MRSALCGFLIFLCAAAHAEAATAGHWYYTVLCLTMQDADRYEALYNSGIEPAQIAPLMRRKGDVRACTSTRFVVTGRKAPLYIFRMRGQVVYAFDAIVRREKNGERVDEATKLSISNRARFLSAERAVVLWTAPN